LDAPASETEAAGRVRRLCGLTWLLLGVPAAVAGSPPDRDLVRTYYDLEVAGYCGLATDSVGVGFRVQRNHIMQLKDIDDASMQQARMQGWKEAHLEWQNRGLGGFKGWCRTEGAAAAQRFREIAERGLANPD